MLRTLIVCGLLGACLACSPKAPEAAIPVEKPADAKPVASGGAAGGPTPISPALGGASPVVGGESVGGGGGGSAVGQLAKDKARSIATDAGSRSLDADPGD